MTFNYHLNPGIGNSDKEIKHPGLGGRMKMYFRILYYNRAPDLRGQTYYECLSNKIHSCSHIIRMNALTLRSNVTDFIL